MCVRRFHAALREEFHPLTIFLTCTINIFAGVWNMKNVTTNKIMGFWTVTWCSLVDRYRCFGGICRLYLQVKERCHGCREGRTKAEIVIGLIYTMTLRDCHERADMKGEQFKKHKRKNTG